MKRVNRREFTKLVGGAALVAPLASSLAWPQEGAKKPEPPAPQAKPAEVPARQDETKPETKPKLTREQEEAVKKAIDRRDKQLESLRSRTLPYDAEPAFVFAVKPRERKLR